MTGWKGNNVPIVHRARHGCEVRLRNLVWLLLPLLDERRLPP